MVITTNTTLSVRSAITEALKSFNSNPFSSAGLYEDALNAEDAILMQISDQTKKVTLEDLGGYIGDLSANLTVANVLPLFSGSQFETTNDVITLIDADYLVDTTYTAGDGIDIGDDNVITCTVTDTTYDEGNKLGYEYLTEPTQDGDGVANIDEPTFTQDLLIQDPEFVFLIEEPTSSVSATTIEGTDYKYLAFPYTSGAENTEYTIDFPEHTLCDIFIVHLVMLWVEVVVLVVLYML